MNKSDDGFDTPLSRTGIVRLISVSDRIYRRLLVIYPEDFRSEYAGEMARYFGEMCEDALRRGGLLALLMMWLQTLSELALSARAERARTIPQTERESSTAVLLVLCFWPGAGQAYNGQPVKGIVHALVTLTLLITVIVILPQSLGLWFLVMLAGFVVYSTLDAWVIAKKINVALRNDS